MAEIIRKPLARCDVCGATAEKEWNGAAQRLWKNPPEWGFVKVEATEWGTGYPNQINFPDLCPDCNKKIHDAVNDAIDTIHKRIAERPR